MKNISELKNEEIKPTIEAVLKGLEKRNPEKLIKFLETSDFYTAPASTLYHGNFDTGLARHSLQVYNILVEKVTKFNEMNLTKISEESVIITALCHDLCKVNFYKKTEGDPATEKQMSYLNSLTGMSELTLKEKNGLDPQKMITKRYVSKLIDHFKNNGRPEDMPKPEPEYEVDDQFPLGHGEKSLFLLAPLMELTAEEACAIRWHMIAFEIGTHFDYPSGFPFRKSIKDFPLVTLLFTADYEASNIFNT